MKLRIGTVVVALSLLLPACSVGSDAEHVAVETEVVTEVVEPEPETQTVDAFHFESGTLELGPFDPLEVYPDVFDPCQEISDEEFAKAGLETDGVTIPQGNYSALYCVGTLEHDPAKYGILIGGSATGKTTIESQATVIDENASSKIPNVFLFIEDDFGSNNCSAVVSTNRGNFSVLFSDGVQKLESLQHCKNAILTLEKLQEG
ncbi:DUF3558 domain-containing protein [Corynebacterium pilosum]|uniref:Secreted protein n=1 Tax=Corynebacterium pilosum TaxID=35756 RepID=A0A376CPE0_9CORY|nr:DUF3558 domain-containing protein [Corynebacterium pilosum]STC70294.1 Uncharacterised protein [Corynebacterium pilosum]